VIQELKSLSLGYAAAVVASIGMLIFGIIGNLGIYDGAVQMIDNGICFFP